MIGDKAGKGGKKIRGKNVRAKVSATIALRVVWPQATVEGIFMSLYFLYIRNRIYKMRYFQKQTLRLKGTKNFNHI